MLNKLLIVAEKYIEGRPAYGPPITDELIEGAISSTGLVKEIRTFHYDEMSMRVGQNRMEDILIGECVEFQPDLIIFSRSGMQPGRGVMSALKKQGFKILNWFPDAKAGVTDLHTHCLPWGTHVGIVDSVEAFKALNGPWPERPYRATNVILMYGAVDPRVFHRVETPQDIDVLFLGTIDPTDRTLALRNEYTTFLRDQGINIVCTNYHRQKVLSLADQCLLMNRSKINLNFCGDGEGLPMLKTRIFKVLACNSLLMDGHDSEASHFFVPGSEYVAYRSKEELERLVRYYLAHDAERMAITRAGHDKVTSIFNARNMWGYVFEKMGFPGLPRYAGESSYQRHKDMMREMAR
jgi:hypothetical protein